MSYESPIKLITDLNYKIIEDQERNIYKAVCSYGIDISKDELFRLLYDDRKQYEKGYADGRADRDAALVRCKDCKFYNPHIRECEGFGKWFGLKNEWGDNDFCSRGERREDGTD